VAELGLGCMEMAFVRRVSMGEKTAARVRQVAEETGVALSIHAPYYINLNSREPDKVEGARQRILAAAQVGHWTGARDIALHLAFYHDDPPAEVYARVRDQLRELTAIIRDKGWSTVLRPEVMGKPSQFGTLDEVLDLSAELDGVQPCLDFAHLHAREVGAFNTYDEFVWVLRRVEERLGRAALEDLHIHVSGIQYGDKGEREHLAFADADFNYRDLIRALVDLDCKGLVVCESPIQEDDALILQQVYQELTATGGDNGGDG
jgi:deoxyribonuclease-4